MLEAEVYTRQSRPYRSGESHVPGSLTLDDTVQSLLAGTMYLAEAHSLFYATPYQI